MDSVAGVPRKVEKASCENPRREKTRRPYNDFGLFSLWGAPGRPSGDPLRAPGSSLAPFGPSGVVLGVILDRPRVLGDPFLSRGLSWRAYVTPRCGRGGDLDRTLVVMSRRRRRRPAGIPRKYRRHLRKTTVSPRTGSRKITRKCHESVWDTVRLRILLATSPD